MKAPLRFDMLVIVPWNHFSSPSHQIFTREPTAGVEELLLLDMKRRRGGRRWGGALLLTERRSTKAKAAGKPSQAFTAVLHLSSWNP